MLIEQDFGSEKMMKLDISCAEVKLTDKTICVLLLLTNMNS